MNLTSKRNRASWLLVIAIGMSNVFFFLQCSIPRQQVNLLEPGKSNYDYHHHKEWKIPIFYNLFVNNIQDIPRVEALVREQLSFWDRTFHGDVQVTSLGVPLPNLTQPLLLREYRQKGSEIVTLDAIWEYCQANPFSKIIYLHSKGSFTPRKENDALRMFLTKGAMSQECADLPKTCNVCSSRMSPFPHAHTSGNMWLARCSYLRHLLKPSHFLQVMGIQDNPCRGEGRYAAEHWVHSHPNCNPCDLYTKPSFVWNYENVPGIDEFQENMELAPAPRFAKEPFMVPISCVDRFDTTGVHVLDEYRRIYNMTPSLDWWGWKFYDS